MKIKGRSKTGNFDFECTAGERVLFAGLRGGLALPYECASGTCGTCKARVRDPATIQDMWPEAPGNAYLKRERGEFLMCQTCALADCEISVPSKMDAATLGRFDPSSGRGTIGNVKRLTHDVIAFDVMLDQPVDFDAGQFVVLSVRAVEGGRAYSMVNYERGTRQLRFVVKKKPGGGFSDWLFGQEIEGAEAEIYGPLGRAIFMPEERKNLLCIAGGSGVAGMMSIIARGCDEGYFNDHKGNLFFGVRTMNDVFFHDDLSSFVSAYPENLNVTIALSDEEPPEKDAPCGGTIDFATGFVHSAAAIAMAGQYDNVVAFVAGPPPMVDGALRSLIMDARLPAASIRYDKFG